MELSATTTDGADDESESEEEKGDDELPPQSGQSAARRGIAVISATSVVVSASFFSNTTNSKKLIFFIQDNCPVFHFACRISSRTPRHSRNHMFNFLSTDADTFNCNHKTSSIRKVNTDFHSPIAPLWYQQAVQARK